MVADVTIYMAKNDAALLMCLIQTFLNGLMAMWKEHHLPRHMTFMKNW
jgi:hypothetical protein